MEEEHVTLEKEMLKKLDYLLSIKNKKIEEQRNLIQEQQERIEEQQQIIERQKEKIRNGNEKLAKANDLFRKLKNEKKREKEKEVSKEKEVLKEKEENDEEIFLDTLGAEKRVFDESEDEDDKNLCKTDKNLTSLKKRTLSGDEDNNNLHKTDKNLTSLKKRTPNDEKKLNMQFAKRRRAIEELEDSVRLKQKDLRDQERTFRFHKLSGVSGAQETDLQVKIDNLKKIIEEEQKKLKELQKPRLVNSCIQCKVSPSLLCENANPFNKFCNVKCQTLYYKNK
jgi:hypothetical protein